MHYLPAVLLFTTALAAPPAEPERRDLSNPLPYAPKPAVCPSTPLLRAAGGMGPSEAAWYAKRKPIADAALQTWLKQFGTFETTSYPTIGSAVAGGFLRASLLGAGIHQQLDKTEGTGPMAGLLQAIAYETTLSGSAAYIAGLMQNNWPSINSLSTGLWQPNYAYGMKPGAAGGITGSATAITEIVADVGSRAAAGYSVGLIDVYGRIIGYSNLYPPRGGVNTLVSDTRSQPKFVNAQVPFPIMTAIGTIDNTTDCSQMTNATQYEITPFEFGSWDTGVASFMDMKYLGTRMVDGKPAAIALCTTGFDNLGYAVGTTANVIAKNCENFLDPLDISPINTTFESVLELGTFTLNRAFYAAYPNPFFGQASSPAVVDQPELALVDGGNSGQVIPLWPLLHRKKVGVIFVWDNYYDEGGVGTTGGQIYNTYTQAKKAGLTKMPVIPPPATFQKLGLNKRPGAFGCNDPNVDTFIYVPYVAYIPQTQSTGNLTTTPLQTRNYILNGNKLATNNGNADWPKCVACLIMKKKGTKLPSFCTQCFSKYCYN